ncbi:ABC transporter substrate-binding protein [Prosthecochloris sp. ZM_2]|uniref:metal ABC transporter solute-binding protein, Zn/Mn family n=1 Tax=Prosthecochloris sp. ZM_2 TaxID=2045206 RepID=UPI000DF80794|nr:zinc ABC transporter substrate-binding protein [Prosthecochloris sp. ZM_2]RNA64147.1 ABC transporter substrate-binding protein [Prosthecochloris sp. ZM_2]
MNRVTFLIAALLVLMLGVAAPLSAGSFGKSGADGGNDRLQVVTSIVPLQFFVDRIGGDRVETTVMVPPGGNPHSYEPTPGQMVALSTAQLFVKAGSGVEFELEWMERFKELYPALAICNASQGIALRSMDEHVHHSHRSGGGNRLDPHIWLSPANGVTMAENICNSLAALDPAGSDGYRRNFADLKQELEALSAEIHTALAGISSRTFLVFHPAWGYYAEEFGLRQIAAEAEGKELTPKSMMLIVRQAEAEDIRVMFISPQFSPAQAESIAREIGGVTRTVDPLSHDYIGNLRHATAAFSESFR